MPKASMKDLVKSVISGKWALLAPVILLGGIYGGIFTPTEASVIAVAYGLITGLRLYRGLVLKDLGSFVLTSMKTTAIVMFIIAVASIFGWLPAYERVPDKIVRV